MTAAARTWHSVQLLDVDGAGAAVATVLPRHVAHVELPGYLLVRGSVAGLERHPLVLRVLSGSVPHAEARAIAAALEAEQTPPRRLRRGEAVTILEGPAASLRGVVLSQTGNVVLVGVKLQSMTLNVTCQRQAVSQ